MRRYGLQEHDEIMPGGMGYSTSNSSHAPERTATVSQWLEVTWTECFSELRSGQEFSADKGDQRSKEAELPFFSMGAVVGFWVKEGWEFGVAERERCTK